MLNAALHEAYDQQGNERIGPEMMPRVESGLMLRSVDQHWQRHLTDLDVLREGIGLMSIAQRDPLVEYKREVFSMWQGMLDEIRDSGGLSTADRVKLMSARPSAADRPPAAVGRPMRQPAKASQNQSCADKIGSQ